MSDFYGHNGPWKVGSTECSEVIHGPNEEILFTIGSHMTSSEEDAANSSLVIAAPDMLHALQTAEFVIKGLAGPSNAKDKSLYLVRNAIKKALGN